MIVQRNMLTARCILDTCTLQMHLQPLTRCFKESFAAVALSELFQSHRNLVLLSFHEVMHQFVS
jgi:hypothetical protein